MPTHDDHEKQPTSESSAKEAPGKIQKARPGALKLLRIGILCLVAVFLVVSILAYTVTPAAIRKPSYQHYHLRLQVSADGTAVDFSKAAFQEGYSKDNCNADLTAHPFHFHDSRDQLAHVHWDHMTGGLLLKYYGWNYIGGPSNTLGYRFDRLPKVSSVPIHGEVLPKLAQGDQLYVYTGDKDNYSLRNASDFLHQDFEQFLGKQSNLGNDGQTSFLDKLFPKAYAHSGEHHDSTDNHSEADLEAVNNLLGNIVIFAQKDKPSDAQVKDRFDHLIPLEASTCGG